jgi:integrase
MSNLTEAFGSQIANKLQISSPSNTNDSKPIQTLADLITAIAERRPGARVSMLRTTANYYADYIGIPIENLPLQMLVRGLSGFSKYLSARKLSYSSVRAYRGYASSLLKLARDLGWIELTSKAEAEWKELQMVMQKADGFSSLVQYALNTNKSPSQLSENDLALWASSRQVDGLKYQYTRHCVQGIRLAIAKANLETIFPLLSGPSTQYRWGIATKDMPEPMRSEVEALLKWKQDKIVKGRSSKQRLRPVSAGHLRACISRLYGYAITNFPETELVHLFQLINEKIISGFVFWSVNDRQLSRAGLGSFWLLIAAAKNHPDYNQPDGYSWFPKLMAEVPEDSDADLKLRKAAKYLPYDDLSTIPEMLAAIRKRKQTSPIHAARLAHDELLIRFLLNFSWRQHNLRCCRLGPPEKANLLKAGFSPLVLVAKPDWVIAACDEDSQNGTRSDFWQTKIEREVRGVVPGSLVPLIEAYLQHFRPLLVGDEDPGTLFLNHNGKAMTQHNMTNTIGNLTLNYAGRRVTPHMFRDSYAHCYLSENPEDYLTLSKILWHTNIQTTIKKYGRAYDESHGICKSAAWIEKRNKRK